MTTSSKSFRNHVASAVTIVLFCGISAAGTIKSLRQSNQQPYYAILATQVVAAEQKRNNGEQNVSDVRANHK